MKEFEFLKRQSSQELGKSAAERPQNSSYEALNGENPLYKVFIGVNNIDGVTSRYEEQTRFLPDNFS